MTKRWLAPLAIAVQAFLLWKVGEEWLAPLVAVVVAASAALVARPIAVGRQASAAIAAGLAIAALIANGLMPPVSELVVADRFDQWSLLLAGYLLVLQALTQWRKSAARGDRVVPMLSLAVLVCVLRERYAIADERTLLALAIAVAALAVLQFGAGQQSQQASDVLVRHARWLQAGMLLIAACGAWLLAPAWRDFLLNYEGQWPVLAVNAAGRNTLVRRYVENGSLEAITKAQLDDPRRVAIAVYAEGKPGYLRGRVFDTYFRSRWLVGRFPRRRSFGLPITRESHALANIPVEIERWGDGRAAFVVSPRRSAHERLVPMAIENLPNRGDIYFAPLGTRYLQGQGDVLRLGDHDVVLAGVATNATYVAHCAPQAHAEAPQGVEAERLLTPPLGVEPAVASLAERVCGGRRSTREKIAAVTDFFRSTFRYSTDSVERNGREPLSQFLLGQRTGHCEYFASGAVALLRLAGVPCRYATGYVVTEYDDDAECWIARNQNAHAWAEAYVAEEQRWVIVEATPGINAPIEPEEPIVEQVAKNQRDGAAQAAGVGDSWWSRIARGLVRASGYWPYTVFSAVVFLGAMYWWQSRRTTPTTWRQARFRAMHRELRRVDRRAKRRGFTRAQHETLHRFARRLAAGVSDELDDELAECAAWYERYAERRYNEGST